MQLSKFARRRYTSGATPIEFLPHLTAALDGPDIYMKRDDLTGLTLGGNKTRKLEFLVADAIANGCDTLVTVGAVQSNHCRLTLAAAAREGLKCRLVLEQRVPGSYDPAASGNNFLFGVLGAETIKIVDAGADLSGAMAEVAGEVAALGRKAYVIPGGGSTPLGSLGYVACFEEIMAQTFDMGLQLDHIVCASGSAGTQAGLVAGAHGVNANLPIIGINVRRPREEQQANVLALARSTAEFAGIRGDLPSDAVQCFDDWVGPGYSLPTDEMIGAVKMLAQLEGVLLDPVYTGKAMAGLIGLIRRGHFKSRERVMFVHTGGAPALYACQQLFRS